MTKLQGVRNRWFPIFSPPWNAINGILNTPIPEELRRDEFRIHGWNAAMPNTIGQWFITIFIERLYRKIDSDIGLRTLIYCVIWCVSLIKERDFRRLGQSALMIRVCLLQGTCKDCMYRSLRELRQDYAFKYVFNIADSFSKFIKLPVIRPTLQMLPCSSKDPVLSWQQTGFMRSFGAHSFLTLPYANTSSQVDIRIIY